MTFSLLIYDTSGRLSYHRCHMSGTIIQIDIEPLLYSSIRCIRHVRRQHRHPTPIAEDIIVGQQVSGQKENQPVRVQRPAS